MEPVGLLPGSQQPASCPYPHPDTKSTPSHPACLKSILILSSHLRLGRPSSPSFTFFTITTYAFIFSPTSATCHAHLILLHFCRSNSIRPENGLALDEMSAEPLSYIKSKNGPQINTQTEVFPCFFLSCKANARV